MLDSLAIVEDDQPDLDADHLDATNPRIAMRESATGEIAPTLQGISWPLSTMKRLCSFSSSPATIR